MTIEKNHPEETASVNEGISQASPTAEEVEIAQESPSQEITTEEIAALKQELEEVRQKSEEYLEGWQRERAEFANFRKRVEREREQIHQNAAGSIIRRYLEILDDLERALKNRPQSGDGAVWAEGIELIYRKLLAALEAEGVKWVGRMITPGRPRAFSSAASR